MKPWQTRSSGLLRIAGGLVFSLCGLPGAVCAKEAPGSEWNIVAIIGDDHARWAVGAYGNRDVRTPNLDRLAAEGVRFDNAYTATPICTPTRASFFTGRWGTQVGLYDWLDSVPHYAERGLDTQARTWPQILRERGYVTGLIGKWHLGSAARYHPRVRGFDHFSGFLDHATHVDPMLETDGASKRHSGYLADILTARAVDFLEQNRDRRFALTIAYREPGDPYDYPQTGAPYLPQEDLDAVSGLDPALPAQYAGLDVQWLKGKLREHYAAIHLLDRSIGRVLQALQALGLAQNTIVVYLGDHGLLMGQHRLYGRGSASVLVGDQLTYEVGNLYEDAVHIPMLVRWPGRTRPGTVVVEPVSLIDLFPTLLAMGGAKGVESAGRDLTPLLQGERSEESRPVFVQYDMETLGLNYLRMVRDGDWKLVRKYFSVYNDGELYNLRDDPGEERNLYESSAHQQPRKRLEAQLLQWQQSIDDPLLPALQCRQQNTRTGQRGYCDVLKYHARPEAR